jgi:hypothetical protein
MLGRKSYTPEELNSARTAVNEQVAAYQKLAASVDGSADPAGAAALEAFEPLFFNNMVIVLDRYFVHRLRLVAGKDGTPVNEVELLSDSLMNNDGVLLGNKVIRYLPEKSVSRLKVGDRIRLSQEQFERIAAGFFAEIESKFL